MLSLARQINIASSFFYKNINQQILGILYQLEVTSTAYRSHTLSYSIIQSHCFLRKKCIYYITGSSPNVGHILFYKTPKRRISGSRDPSLKTVHSTSISHRRAALFEPSDQLRHQDYLDLLTFMNYSYKIIQV